jgi:hypothetical protein
MLATVISDRDRVKSRRGFPRPHTARSGGRGRAGDAPLSLTDTA